MDLCQRSEHVIDCYALGSVTCTEDHLCLLMELSDLGSVELQYNQHSLQTRRLDALQTQKLVRQVTAGVHDMHQLAHAVHRDLKWGNLLLFGDVTAPHVKICDFGISRFLKNTGDFGHTVCGTPEWMAPEQADPEVGQDWRVDSFQLGLLVLALRTGKSPFWWFNYRGKRIAERSGMLAAALDDPISPYDKNEADYKALGAVERGFVKRCLAPLISRRPSPTQLLRNEAYLQADYDGA